MEIGGEMLVIVSLVEVDAAGAGVGQDDGVVIGSLWRILRLVPVLMFVDQELSVRGI